MPACLRIVHSLADGVDRGCLVLHHRPELRDDVRTLDYTNHTSSEDIDIAIVGAYCPRICVLHLEPLCIGTAQLDLLTAMAAFSHVTHLTFTAQPAPWRPIDLLRFLQLLPRLTHLSVTAPASDEPPPDAPLPPLPFSLTRYEANGAFPGRAAPMLCSRGTLRELLVCFDAHGEAEHAARELLDAVALVAPDLRLLHLGNMRLDPDRLVASLGRCVKVRDLALDFAGCPPSAQELATVLDALPGALCALGLSWWIAREELVDGALGADLAALLRQTSCLRRLRQLRLGIKPPSRVAPDALALIETFCRSRRVRCTA